MQIIKNLNKPAFITTSGKKPYNTEQSDDRELNHLVTWPALTVLWDKKSENSTFGNVVFYNSYFDDGQLIGKVQELLHLFRTDSKISKQLLKFKYSTFSLRAGRFL